jgi:hypothetical protein
MPSTATKTTATTFSGNIRFLLPSIHTFVSWFLIPLKNRCAPRVKQDANASEIKKAYYKLSLKQ